LTQPEQGLLAKLGVRIALGDLEQLVRSGLIASLREHENHLLAHGAIGSGSVHGGELAGGQVALLGPEQGLLSHLGSLLRIPCDCRKPPCVLLGAGLGEGEHDLLLELLTTKAAVEAPEEGDVLAGSALAQPEDRLLSPVLRYIASLRERAEGLHGPIASLLRQG